jgi:hypothetical protein
MGDSGCRDARARRNPVADPSPSNDQFGRKRGLLSRLPTIMANL